MLTIAQITDLHISSARDPLNQTRNAARLSAALAAIHALRPRPAAIIASGDLTDTGDPEEYAALAGLLAGSEIPIHLAIGNHDRRAPLLAAFTSAHLSTDASGFVQYVQEIGELRLVVCDTVEEGNDQGAFCSRRADWLERTLDEAPERPTIVVLHHPPIPCGIQWMDPPQGTPWIATMAGILAGRPQVQAVICGHVHRAYHGVFAGRQVSVCAATSLQLTLDLTALDRRRPDGRQILVGEPPGFALLCWDGASLTVHTCVAGAFGDQITYVTPFERG